MDQHLAHAAEVASAHQLRRKVFMVRNLLCGLALLGGGVLGLVGLNEERAKHDAAKAAAAPNESLNSEAQIAMQSASGPPARPREVIKGWNDKGRLISAAATDMSGRPLRLTRNPLDSLPFRRDSDHSAEATLTAASEKAKADPIAVYVDTASVARESAISRGHGYTERFPHVTAMEEASDGIPPEARAAWDSAVAYAREAQEGMVKARIAGTHAERFGLYSASIASLRKAYDVLDRLETSSDKPYWAYEVAKQLVNSMIYDCNKSSHSG